MSLSYRLSITVLSIFLFLPSLSKAQAWGDVIGARFAGMNNASVALQGLWNVHSNPAGITQLNEPMAGINYNSRFMMNDLSTKSIALLYPVQWGKLAINMNYFGSALYHETKAGLVYARKLSKNLSAGIDLEYLSVTFGEGYGTSNKMTFGFGIQYAFSKVLTLGAYVFNPFGIRQDSMQSIAVPFLYRTGLAYTFSDKLLTSLETEYNSMLLNWNIKAGIEFKANRHFAFRTGVGLRQQVFSFGMGYRWKKFSFNVASTLHQQLGLSSQFSVTYTFRK